MLKEMMAAAQIGYPILSVLVFLPVLLAVMIAFIKDDALARKLALFGALAELALACWMLYRFVPGVADVQFAEKSAW